MRSSITACRWFSVVVSLLLTGCGGTPAPRPRPAAAPHANTAEPSSHSNTETAQRTRASTLTKQGDWGAQSEKVVEVMPIVRDAAARSGLPEDLVLGVIWVESRFNPRAVSKVGARGLMQLMPKTAEYLAECIDWQGRANAFDPEFNIAAGSYYVARLLKEFDGDLDLALAAYNAGPTKVRRWLATGPLPPVSVEYATMVQTARRFFGEQGPMPHFDEPTVAEDALDRLGLAILISGLSRDGFGLERENDAKPFE